MDGLSVSGVESRFSLEQRKTELRDKIQELQRELGKLEALEKSECEESALKQNGLKNVLNLDENQEKEKRMGGVLLHGLTAEDVTRYSRQMLVPKFGVKGQQGLKSSSILVIGAGGLGSPAALYLAAAGIGRLGIVDRDVVELNNLHRQIIHSEKTIDQSKATSAAEACRRLNSSIEVVIHPEGFTPKNAMDIISRYSIVVDATDNVASRYLINDACILAGKPLVSGAALGTEGQMTVYGFDKSSPCYRCLFPLPPPSASCQRCSDAGVIGVVPGVVGILQAVEAIKLASKVGDPMKQKMIIYDALSSRFLSVKLRGRNPECFVCGDFPALTTESISGFDYENFTQSPLHDKGPSRLQLLPPERSISARAYADVAASKVPHVLLDVRPRHHFDMAALPNAINIPLSELSDSLPALKIAATPNVASTESPIPSPNSLSIFVLCRRGNDSQRAVLLLDESGFEEIVDIKGGLQAWAHEVDNTFPLY